MRPDARWSYMPALFWHNVRVLSETLGYSKRKVVLRHSISDIERALSGLGLGTEQINAEGPGFTVQDLVDYFVFRADLIERTIATNLQTAQQAKALFEQVAAEYTMEYVPQMNRGKENARIYTLRSGRTVGVPYNKQKGDKYDVDFLTGTSNILLAHYLGDLPFDPDPRRLPVLVDESKICGSMSRRMDGAFPSCTNPLALWEFKCYYYTTTFGSKISDAIYISDLDGYERRAIKTETGRDVELALFVDAYSTWMEQGKSYLCRMVDLLQRGAVDEIVVGREIVTSIPEMVTRWVRKYHQQLA